MVKSILLIAKFMLIVAGANAQISDTVTYDYKVKKFETLLKYNKSEAIIKAGNGTCNLEISFIMKGKEIVVTNEEGFVLSFYKIIEGETETKKYSPTKTSTTYQCIGMDSKRVIIILSKDAGLKINNAEVYISTSTLLHSIIYHFYLTSI